MPTHQTNRSLIVGALLAGSAFAQTSPAPAPAAAKEDVIQLEDFVITSERATGYRASNAITATGVGSKIGDTPLAITVVTGELIRDTAGLEMREALNMVPGVLTNPRSESAVTIRGFGGLISYRNGMYRRQLMTTWNMDRIEVIKGPAAIFFGAVRPGGIVNNVTTKPSLDKTFTDVKLTGGNESFKQGEIFHNQVLSDKLALRVGVGSLDVDGKRNFEYKKEYYLGASLLWKPTPNQQLTFDAEGINREVFYLSSYPVRSIANSLVYNNPAAIAFQANDNRQYTSNSADARNRAFLTSLGYSGTSTASNFMPLYDMFVPYAYGDSVSYDALQSQEGQAFDLEYLAKVGDKLVIKSSANYAFDDTSGIQPSDGDVRPYADGTLRFRVEDFINVRHSYNIQNKVTYRLDFLGTSHTFQLGQELQRVQFVRPGYYNASKAYVDSPGNTGTNNATAITNPYVVGFRPGVTTPVSLRAVLASSGQTYNIVRRRSERNEGYYLVDQAKFFKDRLFVLGGARYNRFSGSLGYDKPVSNSSQSAANGGLANYDVIGSKGGLTPQFGFLAKVLPGVGVFGTYSGSIEPNFSLDADGVASEPVESQSYDFGIKTDLLDGRFTSTIAFYDIKRQNLAYRDTTRETATGRSPYYIFGNEEASQGLEIEGNWSVTNNWNLIAGWSNITKATVTKSNQANLVGRRFGGIPENSFNAWTKYDFKNDVVRNLSVGFGVRYQQDTNLSADPNNAVVIPEFWVFDAMASYKFKAMGRDIKAQLNVKNLTDKLYREGADGYFGQSRTILLSFATRF